MKEKIMTHAEALKTSDPVLYLSTVRDWIRYAVTQFTQNELFFGHGYPGPETEASYLVLHQLGLSHATQDLWLDAVLLPGEREALCALLDTRIRTRKPAAYLTREAWLGPYRFYVDERTIVPRSFIADALNEGLEFWIPDFEHLERVADICTGGGSLAILLALKCPQAQVDAVDLSMEALQVAALNREAYGLEEQIQLRQGDLFEGLAPEAYDLIVSNPPYVDAHAMASLPPEYRQEPALALASGDDGLDHTRRLLTQAAAYLKPNGILVVEVGHQRARLEAAFARVPFTWLDLPGGDSYVFVLRREDLPA